MTKVVDLTGKVITEPIPATTPLSVLKEVVAEIEAWKVNPENILLLTMEGRPDGKVSYHSWSNNLTLETKLWFLEAERFRIMSGDD